MDKFQSVLYKIVNRLTNIIAITINGFVTTVEVVFATVGEILGVINDNIGRIKNLFSGKR